jgi:hypothetical protein
VEWRFDHSLVPAVLSHANIDTPAIRLESLLVSTSLMQRLNAIGPPGDIVSSAGKLVPYVLVSAAFEFIYIFMPNMKVRYGPALFGAVAGGVLLGRSGVALPHSSWPLRSMV